MNRLGIILLLSVTMLSSIVLGTTAAKVNYKILPSAPILIPSQQENNGITPKINRLNVTSLTTANIVIYPWLDLNSTVQTEFKQGEIMGIYFSCSFSWDKSPQAFVFSSTGDGTNEYIYLGGNLSAHLVRTLQIYDSDGQLIADSDDISSFGGGGSSSGSMQTSYRRYLIQISYSWNPGVYRIRAHIEDVITSLEDSEETIISIIVGPPPQDRHPSPIATSPANLIIGLTDLPDGWTISQDSELSTVIEEWISGFERSFNKPVGEFKHSLYVRITQFENVATANKGYYARLEQALSNERYGHGQAVMKDIGDGGFLYDNVERRSPDWGGWNVDGKNASSWASGSWVVFREENVVVIVSDVYNYGAICQGVFITPEELVEFAMIQEAKILSQA